MVLLILLAFGAALAVVTLGVVLAPVARCLELAEDELSADLAGVRAGFLP